MEAIQHFRRRLRELERDPQMRKGVLIERLLRDPTVDWNAIFDARHRKGRHRHKSRWRRSLIAEDLQRSFPRGGRRPRRAAAPPSPPPDAGGPPKPAPDGPELADVATEAVWRRFRRAYPVLSVYRNVWKPHSPVARAKVPMYEWDDLWGADRPAVSLPRIARTLDWPSELDAGLPLLGPLAERLWPDHPWGRWISADAAVVHRAAVPFLRRAACLLHGFLIGGGDPRAVWEAIRLPGRRVPAGAGEDPT